ncbi:biotin transporter BioY [Marispirochaeta sp.]|jgi:biotin transport system substrate-specific component|uniref:biotin transporter BioY n=1 Tax=Marispirochaeta sp. TaxID=2038653 RepID=UPI0029C8B895|nr:biotin transporter BioY [Marispirochaeta sp.]
MNQIYLTRAVHAAVFAALIILGTFIRVPIGPVPIVMANFFVILAGLFLGPLWGTVSILLYLLLGAIGLPVFSAGGGVAVFAGPTGGYLLGYPVGALVAGAISRKNCKKLSLLITAAAAGISAVYLTGVPWLMWRVSAATGESVSLVRGLSTGLLPFLPGDILKLTAAAFVARSLNRLSSGSVKE